MENQKMPEYETIRAAVAGEKWAVEKVVDCYKDEIDRLSTVAVRQPDGSTKQEINEDMRQSITKKLIEALSLIHIFSPACISSWLNLQYKAVILSVCNILSSFPTTDKHGICTCLLYTSRCV